MINKSILQLLKHRFVTTFCGCPLGKKFWRCPPQGALSCVLDGDRLAYRDAQARRSLDLCLFIYGLLNEFNEFGLLWREEAVAHLKGAASAALAEEDEWNNKPLSLAGI
jgi:hypothetical protein